MAPFATLMKRLGFVKLGSYGLVLTPDDRVASTRPHVLEDGLGTPIVGWRDADLAAAELPRWGEKKGSSVFGLRSSARGDEVVPPVRAMGSIAPAEAPPVAKSLPGVAPYTPTPTPTPAPAPALAEDRRPKTEDPSSDDDWEWVIAIARARAESAEDTKPAPKVALPPTMAAKPAAVTAVAAPRTVIPLPTAATGPRLVDTVQLRGRSNTVPPPVPAKRNTMPAIVPPAAAKPKVDTVITTSHASIPPGSTTAPMRAVGLSKTAPLAVVADPTKRAVVKTVAKKPEPRDPDKTQVGLTIPTPPPETNERSGFAGSRSPAEGRGADTIDEPIVADNLARLERVSASASKARMARGTDPLTKTLAAAAAPANDDRTETNIMLPPAATPVSLPSVKRLARR